MAVKLSARQRAQAGFLETLPPKIQKVQAVIERMAGMQADESAIRGMTRALEEIKAGGTQLGLGGIAETAGHMVTLARRGGGLQMKVRGLRELLGSLKVNFEGALRSATTPEAEDLGQEPTT